MEEVPFGLADEAWRSGDGGRFGLRITEAGLRAIGVPALMSGLEQPTTTPQQKPPRPGSKQAKLIELLREPSGRTVDELATALGWLPHAVRAAITGLRKSGHGAVVEAAEDRCNCRSCGFGNVVLLVLDEGQGLLLILLLAELQVAPKRAVGARTHQGSQSA